MFALVGIALFNEVSEAFADIFLFSLDFWWSVNLLDGLTEFVKVWNSEVQPFSVINLESPSGDTITATFSTIDF